MMSASSYEIVKHAHRRQQDDGYITQVFMLPQVLGLRDRVRKASLVKRSSTYDA